jgi:hypothetical protein
VLTATDDQVIEDPDVEKRQRLLQALGDLAVGLAGLRVPARMIVEEDDGDGVEVQGALGNHPVVDFASVGGAGEEVLVSTPRNSVPAKTRGLRLMLITELGGR